MYFCRISLYRIFHNPAGKLTVFVVYSNVFLVCYIVYVTKFNE